MYVALTRAKERLTITYPVNVYDRTTGMVLSKPSRFVDHVPPTVLEPWALTDAADPRPGAGEGGRGRGDGHGDGHGDDPGLDGYFNQEAGW